MAHRSIRHLGPHRLEHFPLSGCWAIVRDSTDPTASDGCHGEIDSETLTFETPEAAADHLAGVGVMVAADGRTYRFEPDQTRPAPLAGEVERALAAAAAPASVAARLRLLAHKATGKRRLVEVSELLALADRLEPPLQIYTNGDDPE